VLPNRPEWRMVAHSIPPAFLLALDASREIAPLLCQAAEGSFCSRLRGLISSLLALDRVLPILLCNRGHCIGFRQSRWMLTGSEFDQGLTETSRSSLPRCDSVYIRMYVCRARVCRARYAGATSARGTSGRSDSAQAWQSRRTELSAWERPLQFFRQWVRLNQQESGSRNKYSN
jgi:hypothetical protein